MDKRGRRVFVEQIETVITEKRFSHGKRGDFVEFIKKESICKFSNPGVSSEQLLNPDNSSSQRVTITRVHLQIGACQPRHAHKASEQIWIALKGKGRLLLADNMEMDFSEGDVVRFSESDIHGLLNTGDSEFIYFSVTSPPLHFGNAYSEKS